MRKKWICVEAGSRSVSKFDFESFLFLPNSILIRYICLVLYMYVFSFYGLKKKKGWCACACTIHYYYIKCTSTVCVYYAMLNSISDDDDE